MKYVIRSATTRAAPAGLHGIGFTSIETVPTRIVTSMAPKTTAEVNHVAPHKRFMAVTNLVSISRKAHP